MESLSASEIAVAIGAPTVGLLGGQDLNPGLHPELTISQLHYDDGTQIAFRVIDTVTKDIIMSKLPEENAPGDVDGTWDDVRAIHQHVSFEVMPALYAALPDLDPKAKNIVRGITIGGQEMIADMVGGQIQNLRAVPSMPDIAIDKGVLTVDTSSLDPADKATVDAAISDVVAAAPISAASSLAQSAKIG